MKIGMIGTGNMGGAIMRGYTSAYPNEVKNCYIYNVHPESANRLKELTGVNIKPSIKELVAASDMIIMAIKPYHYKEIFPFLAECDLKRKTIMSMAAGISIAKIQDALGPDVPIVRIMPNTPALVLMGMTAVWHNGKVEKNTLEGVMTLLSSFGKVIEMEDEELVHAVGVASGSSPAYTYMFIEAIARASEKEGLKYEDALIFAAQAVMGSAKMVLESGIDPVALREAVCSPNGTTIEAVHKLQENGFEKCIEEAVHAAYERSKEIAKEQIL